MSKCDILLVIIGDNWLCVDDNGQSRLENPADFVRIEIEAALNRDIPVIPVPVGNANIPRENQLPAVIKDLSYRNAAEVRAGTAFKGHIERLIQGIDSILAEKPAHEPQPESDPLRENEDSSEGDTTRMWRSLSSSTRLFATKPRSNTQPVPPEPEPTRTLNWIWVGCSVAVIAMTAYVASVVYG